jgi:hypothetical protein
MIRHFGRDQLNFEVIPVLVLTEDLEALFIEFDLDGSSCPMHMAHSRRVKQPPIQLLQPALQ